MNKIVLFISLLIIAFALIFIINKKESPDKIYGQRIEVKLKKDFHISLDDKTKLIVVNSQGCIGCINKTFDYIRGDSAYSNYTFIVTNNFVKNYGHDINKKNIILDENNVFENLNVPIYGVTNIYKDRKDKIYFKIIIDDKPRE
jgi:hypothetical protein